MNAQDDLIAGGFTKQRLDSPDVQYVAKQVTELMKKDYPNYKFLQVNSAATQVVAGINYILEIEFLSQGQKATWRIRVYESLQGELTIHKKEQLGGTSKAFQKISEIPVPNRYTEVSVQSEEISATIFVAIYLLQEKAPEYKFVKLHKAAIEKENEKSKRFFLLLEFRHKGKILFRSVILNKDEEGNLGIENSQDLKIDTSKYKVFHITGQKDTFPPQTEITVYWRRVQNIYFPQGRFEKQAKIRAIKAPFPGGGVSGEQITLLLKKELPHEKISQIYLRSISKGKEPEDYQNGRITIKGEANSFFNNYVSLDGENNLLMFLDISVE